MTKKWSILVAVLALVLMAVQFAGPAVGQESSEEGSRGLLVNVTTDDTWSANMAITLATGAATSGLETVIFLNVRGVYLADAGRMPATEGNSDLNIHEKLLAFMDAGGMVMVCPGCSQEAGITPEDLIPRAMMGKPGGIIPLLASPDYNIISYNEPPDR